MEEECLWMIGELGKRVDLLIGVPGERGYLLIGVPGERKYLWTIGVPGERGCLWIFRVLSERCSLTDGCQPVIPFFRTGYQKAVSTPSGFCKYGIDPGHSCTEVVGYDCMDTSSRIACRCFVKRHCSLVCHGNLS